ncbi:tetratricopeptide repeat protein [Aliagarivorans taiwanensis]|uniref:tetratricopeptide repeat protein n=1 Tax=Aliagarivorans taiwanensis TaxID=561966 RepID=UPI000418B648|nr:hypothetical protein [Aliagarivorans taiwanensis]
MIQLVTLYVRRQVAQIAMLVGALLFGASVSLPSQASELAAPVARAVHRAYELNQDEKLDEALKVLESLAPSRQYDQAYVQRMLGIFYWQAEKPEQAAASLKLAADAGVLEGATQQQTLQALADISLNNRAYSQAERSYQALLAWQGEPVPTREQRANWQLRLTQVFYQQEKWKALLASVDAYETLVDSPDDIALNMRLNAQMQLSHWKGALQTSQRLLARHPDEIVWWQQQTSLYLRLKQPKAALASLQQMDRAGHTLSEQELRSLSQLYANQRIPEQAAKVLARLPDADSDIELIVSQARYWQQAREWDKALAFWQRASDKDVSYAWDYGRLLAQQNHYQQALAALERLPEPTAEQLLAKVQVLFRLEHFESAKSVAEQAHRLKPSDSSASWLQYLSSLGH